MEQLTSPDIVQHMMLHLSVSLGLWLLVIFAILLDLWDGIYTAKKLHQRVHSHKLRVTIAKISEYWRLMLIGFIIDTVGVLLPFYALPYLSMCLCIGLICVEAKSMLEHAKKRSSATLQLHDIFKMAIDCATEADAKDMLKKFGEYLDATELKKKINGNTY